MAHLAKMPTYFVKGDDRKAAYYTIQARELISKGYVQEGEEKPQRIKAHEAKPVPEVAVEAGGDAFEMDSKVEVEENNLEDMTKACKKGDVRAMIVSGPPGVGKSFGVEKVLGKHDTIATLGERPAKYQVVKGAMSAIGLYCKLYNYADKDNVLVFDDCDSVLLDDLSLNILKAALDSKKSRTIHWNTDSFKLRNEGVPDSFEFKGSAIFITNIKFDNVKSKKLRDHLEALESRCHYIDLTIDTEREKMLRIKQIVRDGMLKDYGFTEEQHEAVVDFIDINKSKLRELSLRTVLKVADLAKAFPSSWEAMAESTVLQRA